jgi:hypothetical protein
MNASTSPLNQALAETIARAAANLPNIKAPVDLLGLIGKYGEAMRQVYVPRGGRAEYFDDGDRAEAIWAQIQDEVERLQGIEFDQQEQKELCLTTDKPKDGAKSCG